MDLAYPHAEGDAVWSRRLADEFWSGPVTPLTFSLLAPAMVEQMVRRPLRVAGLDALLDRPVFRLHASHVYVNAGLLAEVVDLLPGFVHSGGLLDLLPSEARARIRPATAFEGLPHAALIAAKLLWREPAWAPWRRAAAFDAACRRVRAADGTLPATAGIRSPTALAAEIRRTQDSLGDYLAVVSWGVVFAYVFYHLLIELVRRWAPELEAEAACLTVGLPGVASLETHHEVLALGRRLGEHPAWRDAARAELPDLAHRITADDGELGAAFRRILTRHGHRLTGRDLRYPTWREAPELLLGLALRSLRAAGGAATRPPPAVRRARAIAAITDRLGGGLDGVGRQAVFRATLAGAQRFCLVRENMRYYADFFLARLRALALVLGARLADDGAIAGPTDVLFITDDELRHLADVAARSNLALAPRITERRHAFGRDAASPPALTLEGTCRPAPDAVDTPAAAPTELCGEVGAPGRCEGRAQLVHTAEDFDQVRRGDVIVAAYADPAWTPMLDLASGLILEAGGLLSHGAIVARELGIPALVNVHDALAWIRTGDTVRLDTAAGCVRLVRAPGR